MCEGDTTPESGAGLSARTRALILLLWMGISTGFLVYAFFVYDRPWREALAFTIYAFVALIVATICIGALNAFGKIEGDYKKIQFTFGGAAAIVIFLLLVFFGTDRADFSVVLYTVDAGDVPIRSYEISLSDKHVPVRFFQSDPEPDTLPALAVVFPKEYPEAKVTLRTLRGNYAFELHRDDRYTGDIVLDLKEGTKRKE